MPPCSDYQDAFWNGYQLSQEIAAQNSVESLGNAELDRKVHLILILLRLIPQRFLPCSIHLETITLPPFPKFQNVSFAVILIQ